MAQFKVSGNMKVKTFFDPFMAKVNELGYEFEVVGKEISDSY